MRGRKKIYRTTNFCFQPWTSANGIQVFCLTKDVSSSAILLSKRVWVAVPHNMAGPLAIRWDTGQNGPNGQEVYVNGVRLDDSDDSGQRAPG